MHKPVMHIAEMPKPLPDLNMAERLRHARKADDRFPNGADAARAMGIPVATYLGHENGSRGFQSSATRYADFYKISLEWLLTGKGAVKRDSAPGRSSPHQGGDAAQELTDPEINLRAMAQDIPILGTAVCGEDGVFEFNGQVADYTRRPPKLTGVKDAYALWVSGDSMYPWRRRGELVYVHPHQPINVGDYVVVQLKPDAAGAHKVAYIKELVRRTERELRLRQFNPREELTIPMSKVATIHRIVDWSELMGL